MNVAILGTGYVGLTTGACLAYLGHDVACLDTDERKIAELQRGRVPFHEPHMAELIALAGPSLAFTTNPADSIARAQVVFIAVGTPPGSGGSPDLTHVQGAARDVGENLGEHFTVVVNKSTVPIGSGNWVWTLLREAVDARHGAKNGRCFAVASNPEFLREGTAKIGRAHV